MGIIRGVSEAHYTLYSYNSGYNANGTAIRWSLTDSAPARVAEYRFDEYAYSGQVGEVRDSSGNARHGVRAGSATSNASGAVCRALDVPANSSATVSGADTQEVYAVRSDRAGGRDQYLCVCGREPAELDRLDRRQVAFMGYWRRGVSMAS